MVLWGAGVIAFEMAHGIASFSSIVDVVITRVDSFSPTEVMKKLHSFFKKFCSGMKLSSSRETVKRCDNHNGEGCHGLWCAAAVMGCGVPHQLKMGHSKVNNAATG